MQRHGDFVHPHILKERRKLYYKRRDLEVSIDETTNSMNIYREKEAKRNPTSKSKFCCILILSIP